jgi:uncharacterized membrane protein
MKRALVVILVVGIAGLVFSGYLSYRELFAAEAEPVCAPVGEPGTIGGYPPCVYGLLMYTAVVAIAAFGLWRGRKSFARRAT